MSMKKQNVFSKLLLIWLFIAHHVVLEIDLERVIEVSFN